MSTTSSPGPNAPRVLLVFTIAALGIGIPLMTLSTFVEPGAPFLLATTFFGLAGPALVLTYRATGPAGVRTLLRDCARLPRPRWWLPLAGLGLPILSWTVGAALGGAQPLTWNLAAFYVGDLLIGALLINLWEEMAWAGFFQRRATSHWGVVGGSLITSVCFTAIHIPLALNDTHTASQVVTNLLFVAGLATGLRLLIARIDVWSGRSLLTVGILHSSFNATESVLDPAYDWVRIAVTIALGIAAVAFGGAARAHSSRELAQEVR